MWLYQVDHRLLLDSSAQHRGCELGFVGVRPLGGNLGPNLRTELISLNLLDDLDTCQLCDIPTSDAD